MSATQYLCHIPSPPPPFHPPPPASTVYVSVSLCPMHLAYQILPRASLTHKQPPLCHTETVENI